MNVFCGSEGVSPGLRKLPRGCKRGNLHLGLKTTDKKKENKFKRCGYLPVSVSQPSLLLLTDPSIEVQIIVRCCFLCGLSHMEATSQDIVDSAALIFTILAYLTSIGLYIFQVYCIYIYIYMQLQYMQYIAIQY